MNTEQEALAQEIAALLTARNETVAVAESTTGGLVSAALLWVPGASRYFGGGGVTYTLNSRVALAGVPAEYYANYRGTTPEMLATLAEAMRQRLGTTWCIAESGLAGPTSGRSGAPPGRTTMSVAGPVTRTEVIETGLAEREANMVAFTTATLRFLGDALRDAPRDAKA
ncbi:MAG: CinA family protein [Dehalococcoidia bacterium]|nr:CinA family protein [Dehalococcoidia bacterium]